MKILTISIAAYNIECYLQPLLDDLITSEYLADLEILVIDDGATDNTLEIAKRYESEYPNSIKAIHKDNGGWGSAVTTGIRLASGRFFKLLDGDDLFDVHELDKLMDYLFTCETDLVITPYLKFYDNSNKTEKPENPIFRIDCPRRIHIEDIPIVPYAFEMYSLTFRTAVLQKKEIMITDHCFYTDNEYAVKGIDRCRSFAVVPYCVYRYRIGRVGQSVSIEGMRKHYREFEYVLRKMLMYTRDCIKNEKVKAIFFTRFAGLSYYYFETLFKLGNDCEYCEVCKQFDLWLKKEFHQIYTGIKYIPIRVLRLTGYRCFRIARRFQ